MWFVQQGSICCVFCRKVGCKGDVSSVTPLLEQTKYFLKTNFSDLVSLNDIIINKLYQDLKSDFFRCFDMHPFSLADIFSHYMCTTISRTLYQRNNEIFSLCTARRTVDARG